MVFVYRENINVMNKKSEWKTSNSHPFEAKANELSIIIIIIETKSAARITVRAAQEFLEFSGKSRGRHRDYWILFHSMSDHRNWKISDS